jgi:Raf kinase inhibitor-like YbhB/YbcL family protein
MKTYIQLALLTTVLFLFSCTSESEDQNQTGSMVFSMKSIAFKEGDSIPAKYTCLNSAQVFPPLQWEGAGPEVKSFALIMDDPDAVPVVGYIWNHWVLYDIPANAPGIAEGINKKGNLPSGTLIGLNSFNDTSYGGPCPPTGQLHHYKFRLFALNTGSLGLAAGADASKVREAMKGKIADSLVLTGTFKR